MQALIKNQDTSMMQSIPDEFKNHLSGQPAEFQSSLPKDRFEYQQSGSGGSQQKGPSQQGR